MCVCVCVAKGGFLPLACFFPTHWFSLTSQGWILRGSWKTYSTGLSLKLFFHSPVLKRSQHRQSDSSMLCCSHHWPRSTKTHSWLLTWHLNLRHVILPISTQLISPPKQSSSSIKDTPPDQGTTIFHLSRQSQNKSPLAVTWSTWGAQASKIPVYKQKNFPWQGPKY